MTTFSKFFHSASSKEKKKVFIKVIKGVVADQKKVMFKDTKQGQKH